MGIGIEADCVSFVRVDGKLSLDWETRRRAGISEYRLKKRWLIPKKWIIPLLNKDRISVWILSILFRASTQEADLGIENLGNWIKIWRTVRKGRGGKEIVSVRLSDADYWNYNKEESFIRNKGILVFRIFSDDSEKMEEIKNRQSKIRGVIYRGKIHEIKMSEKTLI